MLVLLETVRVIEFFIGDWFDEKSDFQLKKHAVQ